MIDPIPYEALNKFCESQEYKNIIDEAMTERDKKITEMSLQLGFIRGWLAHDLKIIDDL